MAQPRVVRTCKALRSTIARWHGAGERVALVPTTGRLHEGHMALVKAARSKSERVVVALLREVVQPPDGKGAASDSEEKADLKRLARVGADVAYAPAREAMFPADFSTAIVVRGPAEDLEGATRSTPGPNAATLLTKLLVQAMPDIVVLGERDVPQIRLAEQLALDLDLPVKVIGVPIFREPDGLAVASGNASLNPKQRAAAPVLFQTLRSAAQAIGAGAPPPAVLAEARARLVSGGFEIDYLEARCAQTLAPLSPKVSGPIRLLAAARLGTTRLVDTVAVPVRRGSKAAPATLVAAIHPED